MKSIELKIRSSIFKLTNTIKKAHACKEKSSLHISTESFTSKLSAFNKKSKFALKIFTNSDLELFMDHSNLKLSYSNKKNSSFPNKITSSFTIKLFKNLLS